MEDIYSLDIADGPVFVGLLAAAAALLVLLVSARSTRWRILRLLVGASCGAMVGLATVVVWNAVGAFGLYLPTGVARRLMAALAAMGVAVACLWDARAWRRVVAGFSVVVFGLAGAAAINSYFGIDRTLGAVLGISSGPSIDLGALPSEGAAPTAGPLYEWTPPADLPAVGRRGTVDIPSSGFAARKAGVYLPPAALTKEAPRLPLVVFMMGYPGTPDPTVISDVLDAFAATHNGLAPIVVVADQIGTRGDPVCADSAAYGPAESYILKDVVPWATRSLKVLDTRAQVAIGGYSNGGSCAFKFAAERPDLFGAMLTVSGEEYPGSEDPASTIRDVFGGSTAAFEAAKPANILARHPGAYSHMTAVFTVGAEDQRFAPGVRRAADAAQRSGMKAIYRVVPGAGHVRGAVDGGLRAAFEELYPVLGLSAR